MTTTTMPGVELAYSTEPRDLHVLLPWLDVIRRLRKAAMEGATYSAVSIVVITDCNGRPLNWTAPKVTRIEPRSNAQALDTLLSVLAE